MDCWGFTEGPIKGEHLLELRASCMRRTTSPASSTVVLWDAATRHEADRSSSAAEPSPFPFPSNQVESAAPKTQAALGGCVSIPSGLRERTT